MKILPSAFVIIAVLVVVGVAIGQDKDKKRDAAVKQEKRSLIGVWKLVSCEGEGQKVPDET